MAVARSPERRAFLEALTHQPAFQAYPRAGQWQKLLSQAEEIRPTLPSAPQPSPVNVDLPDDFAFRMAILESLMLEAKALPVFDVYAFAKTHAGREINLEQEAYDLIPEVRDYLMGLPITPELRAQVKSLSLNLGLSGVDLALKIIPQWDGEDETFIVQGAKLEDFLHFPNLETVYGLAELDDEVIESLEGRGIEVG